MSLDPFEEETEWVPLHSSDHDSHKVDATPHGHDVTAVRHLDVDTKDIQSHNKRGYNSRSRVVSANLPPALPPPQERLLAIQKKHEMKKSIRENLVYRPLASFPKLFMRYLVLEIWNCNQFIRLGKKERHTVH